ncbi:mannose-1-phosphate guanylyltransferase [Clostridium sp. MSJ-4]|uniref:Mannose-1-phosphate guanylyltransferase n=1 Tax=Clostridium simiarum TaxID=2841506 RepID=A0ABS6F1W7_9CLOT|nr:mannose-1-phosphate guanylyltransferase [Clostridium simiarum]MBU5592485.1 mannose-1-phosphate guanylyltransferase [Clostridium simiarum]
MLCALIMAGGKGERFWPMSTDEMPKQFLSLIDEESMIQSTVRRLEPMIPLERVFIVTAENYVDLVKEHIPNIPDRNIIVEPVGKNTAPCVALSAFIIEKYYKDATIAVLPSDHLIGEEKEFLNTLKAAESFIENNEKAILTLGMKPDRPETGYGYIKFKGIKESIDKYEIREVEKFVEKPHIEKAKEYLESGSYLWNAGIFIWKTRNILSLTEKYLTNTYELLKEVAITKEESMEEKLKENYVKVDSISIDYGIMEKADSIYVIPASFGWDDVGSWNSVARYKDKDQDGNVLEGEVVCLKSKNNIINTCKKTFVMGVSDLVVIETENEIMILHKDEAASIRELKAKS